jgi:hypothetical protein
MYRTQCSLCSSKSLMYSGVTPSHECLLCLGHKPKWKPSRPYTIKLLHPRGVPSTQRREASIVKVAQMWPTDFLQEIPASLSQSEHRWRTRMIPCQWKLVAEPYPLVECEKQKIILITTLSCLNIKTMLTERLQVIKGSSKQLCLRSINTNLKT